MELHVFDFDGTLFRSPAPNPQQHDKHTLEMIAQPRSNKGYGWFQHLATLSPPYVPATPAPDDPFFIQEIVSCFHEAKRQGFPTAVLTGRDEKYRQRIQQILASGGIAPDEVILKPGENSGTVIYKAMTFARLARKYAPTRIVYYEDRVDQGRKIHAAVRFLFGDRLTDHELRGIPRGLGADSELLKSFQSTGVPKFEIVMVPDAVMSDTHLPPELEKQLLELLLSPE